VPDGFEDLTKPQVSALRKPTKAQAGNAAAVGAEVKGSGSYRADFGDKAAPQDRITALLGTASAWTVEAARAKRWAAYAKTMSQLSWHEMLSVNDAFQQDYLAALAHDPTIAERYPSLASFQGARSAAAKRGAETKKAKKKNQDPPKA
jgi:hypothetical protein